MNEARRRRVALAPAVAALTIVAYYAYARKVNGRPASRPLAIAHRGGAVHQPENTLAAFRQAVADGVGWIEFDVQRSADGELVVFHDATLDRTTDGAGAVADKTLAELRSLDAGRGQPIPTLAEVLDFAAAAGVGLMPELKHPERYPGIERQLVEQIAAAGLLDRTVVQSFAPATLAAVRALAPTIQTCQLTGIGQFDVRRSNPTAAAHVCLMAEMVLLRPTLIRQAHDDGRLAHVWFGAVEHPWVMRLLLWLGADGLMVDDHQALMRILAG
jgi:glycerophosphoryl diester phosphodiesterase